MYWQRLLAQEQTGEFEAAWKAGLALINLFPQAPQRGAALLKLAGLAMGTGDTAQALELYGLAVCRVPCTPEAAQAALEARALELSRDLSHGVPLPALGHFLEQVTAMPSGYAPETLQEALKIGWQAVGQQARAADPSPLTRVEEAQTLLTQESKKSEADRRSRLQVHGLELACLSQSWPAIANSLSPLPAGEEEQKLLLRSWLSRWRAGVESSAPPFEALPVWFLPPISTACWVEQLPALDSGLKQEWAAPCPDRLQGGLALTFWAEAQFSPSVQKHRPMADQSLRAASSPFHKDRLGLKHLKNGETNAAQQTFQDLAQHNDPFWRRLARVRSTDLELSRLQAEASP